ncbi:MAG: hypothetical protein L6R39_004027 [Caloplaca ligustica]|nr:MAG: hypothetical protein L6R39_004027 [Caloplaca ligustica]
MDELRRKHRQEQKDLQARLTQKKKAATKKTRKGVNDECAELERQLKERQDLEISRIERGPESNGQSGEDEDLGANDEPPPEAVNGDGIESDTPQPNVERTKKPSRQKARLARKAAELESMATQAAKEAEDLPDLRQQESEAMRVQLTSRGLVEHDIRSDGHCLYAAVADQIFSRNLRIIPKDYRHAIVLTPAYQATRSIAASYIKDHADDFIPFLEEPLDDYVRKIEKTGEWGGHLELLALAKSYDVDINVLQSHGLVEKIESGTKRKEKPALWLAYYHHSFGLGEHYNSLRPADS